jgi:Protein of unknown function (DUF2726)
MLDEFGRLVAAVILWLVRLPFRWFTKPAPGSFVGRESQQRNPKFLFPSGRNGRAERPSRRAQGLPPLGPWPHIGLQNPPPPNPNVPIRNAGPSKSFVGGMPVAPEAVRSNGVEGGGSLSMPYKRKDRLITVGEKAFWGPLHLAVKGKYRLFMKVRLLDVVTHPEGRREGKLWFRKIRGYHLDFVICEPKTTRPLLVVELDDRSHRGSKQARRDDFKNQVLRCAGIPLLRVPAAEAYDPAELAGKIASLIAPPP